MLADLAGLPILNLAVGLALLLGGADLLVRGAVATALRLGVSPLLVGLTIVGFGTSTPEMVASVTGALKGSPGLAIGNVVGSNIANVLLILGVSALVSPLPTPRTSSLRDGAVLSAATLLALGVCLYGRIDRPIGVAFLALLVAFLLYSRRSEDRASEAMTADGTGRPAGRGGRRLATSVVMCLAGLTALVAGAALFVDAAIEIARLLNVSDTVIGLTVVAVGTSLPEFATSVVAAARGHYAIAVGNVIGSNIFNIFAILGVTALVAPIPIPAQIGDVDVWVMLASTVLLVGFAITGHRIARWEGGVLLATYAAYVAYLFLDATTPPP